MDGIENGSSDPDAWKETDKKDDDVAQTEENPKVLQHQNTSSMMDQLKHMAEDAVTIPVNFIMGKTIKPRRFVFDRCDGTSVYHDTRRPPCFICYVPVPVKWFPDLLEQNPVCERFGKFGCVRPYDYGLRKIIFGIATVCQLVAFILTFYAAMAMSKDYDILKATSFTHGKAHILNSARPPIIMDVGLLGIAIQDDDNFSGFDGRVVSWNAFCVEFVTDFGAFFDVPACESCGDRSKTLVGSIIMSLLFSIPSFTTDILRFYPDYDVNCQKFFGAVVSFISMISSLATWYGYNKGCVSAFYSHEVAVDENMVPTDDIENAFLIFDFDWEAGYGYLFVVLATLLKIVDVVCNLAVPTPQICRDHAEQTMYEILALNRDVSEGASNEVTVQRVQNVRQSIIMVKQQQEETIRQLELMECLPEDDEDAESDNLREMDAMEASPRSPRMSRDRMAQSVYF